MTPLRLAVIGAGHLGRFHALVAARLDEVELVGVVDPLAKARQRVAAEAGTRAMADFREVADHIQAAVIATPTCTHHAIGMELLERGVSLLIEKPLAPNQAEAHELARQAEQKELVLQVGHVERFNPALRCVESELRTPKFIEATRLSGYSFRSTDIGVVLDVMIHDIDIVLSLTKSPVRKVEALGLSVLGGHEDLANARITFADGCVAQLTASRISYVRRRQMQVTTTRAFATIDFASGQATIVKPREDVLRRELEFGRLSASDICYWKEQLFHQVLVKTLHDPPPVNAIEEEQREFARCVRQKKSPLVNGRAACDAVSVAELILQQIEDHAWDGHAGGRHGPFAMPPLPLRDGSIAPSELRKAG